MSPLLVGLVPVFSYWLFQVPFLYLPSHIYFLMDLLLIFWRNAISNFDLFHRITTFKGRLCFWPKHVDNDP